jgi:transposase
VNSPDLNPIENIWRWLKVYVAKKWPKSREEVEMACIKAWDALDLIENSDTFNITFNIFSTSFESD